MKHVWVLEHRFDRENNDKYKSITQVVGTDTIIFSSYAKAFNYLTEIIDFKKYEHGLFPNEWWREKKPHLETTSYSQYDVWRISQTEVY